MYWRILEPELECTLETQNQIPDQTISLIFSLSAGNGKSPHTLDNPL
jgi:hypothetical protein